MNLPVVRQLDLLLSGTGYNYYKAENLARADDLLIREQAARSLTQAVSALSELHTAYRLRYLPPPSREQPFPPRDESQRAQAILGMRDRITRAGSMIRGMSVPIQDKIWRRMRKELTLLNELMNSDYLLISTCDGIRDLVESLTPETWRDGRGLSEIEDRLRDLDNIMRDRQRILQMV